MQPLAEAQTTPSKDQTPTPPTKIMQNPKVEARRGRSQPHRSRSPAEPFHEVDSRSGISVVFS
jgi:hypothetical protein